ncbi:MAG TPA: MarC family protein [Candidatus Limnocylindrales bacterium]|nr:MarC family protein [Candidatus Limnocylindrales bacterium]
MDFALRALITLFVVVDPAGLVPAYVTLVGSRAGRTDVAGRAVVIAGIVLLVFAVVGGPLLAYLGITLGALQVAGGLLLFRIAVDMVFAQLRRETAEEAAEARARDDVSVFPLAIPLIAGPGALASVLILTSEAAETAGGYAVLLLAGVAVMVIAYLVLRASKRVAGLLGQTGINVVTRVLGLVLAALAVQYVADGVFGLGLVRV